MVFEDITVIKSNGKKETQHFVAVPSDRFLSVLFDVSLTFPFIYFLSSPVMRRWNELSFWGGSDSQFITLSAAMVLFGAVFFFIYQTTCWWLRGATAGQRILRLQVLTQDLKPLNLSQALLRSFLWWLSLVLFALPFLESLFHAKGFCLHDKGSETGVFTDQEKIFRSLSGWESYLLKMSFGLFGFSTLLLIGAVTGSLFSLSQKGVSAVSVSGHCKELPVSGPTELWKSQEAPFSEWALSLFLADELSSECLESLADDGLWGGTEENQSYAYLAKALLADKRSDLKKEYLTATCTEQQNGPACQMAQLEKAILFGSPEDIQLRLDEDFKASSLAYKFLVLKHRDVISAGQVLTGALKTASQVEEAKDFVASNMVKNLWRLGTQERARGALSALVSTLDSKKQLEQLAWFCAQERTLECSTKPVEACLEFNAKMVEVTGAKDNKKFEYTQVVDQSCRNSNARSLASFSKNLQSLQAKKYVQALAQARLSGRHAELHRVMNDPESIYQREAMLQLSGLPVELKLVKQLLARWEKQTSRDLLWQKTGQNLIGALTKYRLDENLITVVSALENTAPFDKSVTELMVSALAEVGHRNQAYRLLQKHWSTISPVPVQKRSPASSGSSDFVTAVESLKKEFGPL